MADDALPRRFGPYVLLAERGRGGAGTVFLARPVERPRDPARAVVIVKLLHPSLLTDPISLQRFRHEALIAVSVSAPELVRVFDVGSVGEVPYIAMEHIAGWSGSEVGRAYVEAARRPPVGLVLAWMCDALVALEALHQAVHPSTGEPMGIVHRDISPKNLLIGEDLRLRVIDFGLGTSNVQDWATRANVMMGTPGYMAPEQVNGARVDGRTDLYALAVVTYEFLALQHYIVRGEPSEMVRQILSPIPRPMSRTDLPPGLEQVLQRGLAVEPERRFQDARAFREALRPFAATTRDRGDLPRTLEDRGEVELTEPGVALLSARAEPTVLYATRASSPFPSTQVVVPPETQVVPAPATRVLEPETRVLRAPTPPPPEARAPIAAITAAIIAGAAGVLGVLWVAQAVGFDEPQSVSPSPSIGPQVAIQAQVQTATQARPAPSTAAPAPRPSPLPAPVPAPPPPPLAAPRPPRPTPQLTPKPSETRAPQDSVEAALTRLITRAKAARARHPERQREVDELLTDASLWSRAEDASRALTMLKALEARLENLDR